MAEVDKIEVRRMNVGKSTRFNSGRCGRRIEGRRVGDNGVGFPEAHISTGGH